MQSGNEGWVERYRRMGYRNFFEEGRHPDLGHYASVAYGRPDQEAPWLAAGYTYGLSVSVSSDRAWIEFTLESAEVEHEFRVDANLCEVLWKGL